MTPATRQVAAPGHVRRPGRHLLRCHRRRRHHQQLGARQKAGQPHLDVARPRRQVDQQVLDVAPMRVLEELLHGAVEHEPAPHDRLLLVGQEAHGQDAQQAGADGALEGDHFPLAGLHVTLHAEQPRDGETPDVGVEDADDVAPGRQGHRQVGRHRRLAHAALARGDGQHAGVRRHRRLRGVLPCLPAGPGHDGRPFLGVHGGHPHLHRAHPVQRLDVADDVGLYLGAQRARGDGQRHLDHDRVAVDRDAAHHPEIDDGVAQLGVDDRPQAVAHLFGAGVHRGCRGGRVGGHGLEFYLRGAEFGPAGPVVRARERRR